jgi:hypothetical protein
MRNTNLPLTLRASNQQNSAVLAPPTCNTPVGLGANRVLIIEFDDENEPALV